MAMLERAERHDSDHSHPELSAACWAPLATRNDTRFDTSASLNVRRGRLVEMDPDGAGSLLVDVTGYGVAARRSTIAE